MSMEEKTKKILGLHIGEKKVILRFEEEKISVHQYTYIEMKLYPGKILSDKDFKEMKYLDELDDYLNYAKKLLLKNTRSEEYIKDKLSNKGANQKQIKAVVNTLKQYHLISDDDYLKELLELYEYKCYGKHKIEEHLKQKGISLNKIKSLKFSDSNELKKAKQLLPQLEKKFAKYNNASKKEHIYAYLLRNGFDGDIAREVSSKAKASDPSQELKLLKKEYETVSRRYMAKYKYEEVNQKVTEYLLRKGYRYSDIEKVKGE